ncbi:CHAD domain-containing protein [Sunxiuqinia sp. A32]|uniref:CHAD domain-containing protein n=1 Tax=Sunxiuqinia sp. A32 TaxID=3461496 RepID=UPI0040462AFD
MKTEDVHNKQVEQAQLHLYYHKLLDEFFLRLGNCKEQHEVNDIHKLRLNLKRMRALWSFVDDISNGEWSMADLNMLVKKLFSEAGKVREAQLNQRLIEKYSEIQILPYLNYLKSRQILADKKLGTQIRNFNIRKLEKLNGHLFEYINRLPKRMILEESSHFIQQKIETINQIKQELPDNHKLHEIRIHLKAIQEIVAILNELGAEHEGKMNIDQADLKALINSIGSWHDYIVAADSLHEFSLKTRNLRVKAQIEILLEEFQNKQIEKQDKILQMLVHSIHLITNNNLKKT